MTTYEEQRAAAAVWIYKRRDGPAWWTWHVLTSRNDDPATLGLEDTIAFNVFTDLESRGLLLPLDNGEDPERRRLDLSKDAAWREAMDPAIRDHRPWSDGTKWVMGIVAVLVVSGILYVFSMLSSHTIYEEADLFEEYYLLVSSHSTLDDALAKEKRLVELSQLSGTIDELPDDMDVIMRSSFVAIGFGPDQVIVARDPAKRGHFIVALDLLGRMDEDDPALVKEEGEKIIWRINNKMNNIENDPLQSPDPKVEEKVARMKRTAAELKNDLEGLTVGFYEIAEYERTYRTTVTRK